MAVVKKMLAEGFDINIIAKIIGLTIEEIRSQLQEMKPKRD